MPLYKLWNTMRTIRKAVVVNSLEELVKKGRERLGLKKGEFYVFDEKDGSEIEDDEVLLSYEKGTVFIMGKEWLSRVQTEVKIQQRSRSSFGRDDVKICGLKSVDENVSDVKLKLENENVSDVVQKQRKSVVCDTETKSKASSVSNVEVPGDFDLDNVAEGTELESEVGSMLDFDEKKDFGSDNVSGGSGLESQTGSMLDFEKKGDIGSGNASGNLSLGNVAGDTGLESEVSSMVDFEEKEDIGLGNVSGNLKLGNVAGDTGLESEAGRMLDFEEKEDFGSGNVAGGTGLESEKIEKRTKDASCQKRKKYQDSEEEKSDWLDEGPSRQKKPTLMTTVLMKANKYRNAKMKKMQIYSEKEISETPYEMEKKRRHFWNEKAEQLCTKAKTASQDVQTLRGIIDVAWTMRKTKLIEEEARRTTDEEVVLSRRETTKMYRTQKQETIPKNLDRLAAAHAIVVDANKKMEKCRENLKRSKSKNENDRCKKDFNRTEIALDGAYTELKRAQDATMKAINVKRKLLDEHLKSKAD